MNVLKTTANVTVTNINYNELRETLSYTLIAGADTLLLNRFFTGRQRHSQMEGKEKYTK